MVLKTSMSGSILTPASNFISREFNDLREFCFCGAKRLEGL
jgi:hypothetical protein